MTWAALWRGTVVMFVAVTVGRAVFDFAHSSWCVPVAAVIAAIGSPWAWRRLR